MPMRSQKVKCMDCGAMAGSRKKWNTRHGEMTEERAREILLEMDQDSIYEDGSLISYLIYDNYFNWFPGKSCIAIEGEYTSEQLKAIAWWMENKPYTGRDRER